MNNTGLPGTGIGGFLYILLGFAMPFVELYFTACGRSSRARWKRVLAQFGIALGIVLSIEATGWLLRIALGFEVPRLSLAGVEVPPVFVLMPFLLSGLTLGGVVLAIRLWGVISALRRAR